MMWGRWVTRQAMPAGQAAPMSPALVATEEEAERVSFRGSPTILIDGVDPFAAGDEPIGLSCRIYRTPDGYAGSPTLEQIAAVLGLGVNFGDLA